MTDTINDRYRVNLILTVLFMLGISLTLYLIYSLPSKLHLSYGYQSEFLKVYIVVGLTFLIGALTMIWALRYKKEIIVFRERLIDATEAQREAASQAGRTTISLETLKTSLADTQQLKELLHIGLQTICKQLEAGQGALYLAHEENGKRKVVLEAGYALGIGETTIISFEFGEGLIGQAASTGQTLRINDIPEGYINIISGLGSSSPRYLVIVAIKVHEHVLGVLEIASFVNMTDDEQKFLEEAAQLIAEKIQSSKNQA